MDVLIIGAGSMARGIGIRLVRGGHTVRVTDVEAHKAKELAAELDGTAEPSGPPGAADVIILALPYPANRDFAAKWATPLDGRVIVDIANPVDFETLDTLRTPPHTASAEEVALAAPRARVVKAFNTTFAGTLASDRQLDVFIAGDDQDARDTVAKLVIDGGMRPIDVGRLGHARALEAFQLLHMKVQDQIHGNWSTALILDGGKS